MSRRPAARWWSLAEGSCWTLAVIALAAWAALHLAAGAGARYELYRFAVLEAAQMGTGTPDQSLWSAVRIKAWQSAMNAPAPPPLGVLRIPRLQLEAPLLAGTDEATLDRGLGHIEDTALPGGEGGNVGIAGHRDGFFRVLKDIAEGDVIEIQTLAGKDVYRVQRTWIVEPDDVSVLDPTPTRALTLVTCYPFYFVGSAPQRFIVRAVSVGNTQQ